MKPPDNPSKMGVCIAALVVFAFEAANACARNGSPLAVYLPILLFGVAVAFALKADVADATSRSYSLPSPSSVAQTAVIAIIVATPLAYHTIDRAEHLAGASICSFVGGLLLVFFVDALFLLGFITIIVVTTIWASLALPWAVVLYLVLALECNSRPLQNTLLTLSLFPVSIAIIDGTLPEMTVFAPALLAMGVKWKLISTIWGWALLIPAAISVAKRMRDTPIMPSQP